MWWQSGVWLALQAQRTVRVVVGVTKEGAFSMETRGWLRRLGRPTTDALERTAKARPGAVRLRHWGTRAGGGGSNCRDNHTSPRVEYICLYWGCQPRSGRRWNLRR